jgi:amidophosphoribosyltransferase
MCGIIGIISKDKQVSYDLHNGLLNLQHRGQDNAGIFTSDNSKMYLHKNKGLVAEVFSKNDIEELKGNVGIGQVRYPTTVGKADAQPFYVDQGGLLLPIMVIYLTSLV